MLDSDHNNFWGKTFDKAFSWINKPSTSNLNILKTASNDTSFPLNSYLTYVTLKLPVIIQGKCFFLVID
jgi:hypothetical protein